MGNVFVRADWSGQELRVLAEISQDENMINAFHNNMDLHLLTANSIFGLGLTDGEMVQSHPKYIEIVSRYKMERHRAKNGVNFPIIYGKTEHTLATDFNISVEEALRWMNEFFKLYPGVKKAIRITELELEEREYVCTMMGRRRRFPGYKNMNKWEKAGALRQAFNFKIQGFSADMMKLAASRIIETVLPKYDVLVVLTIHDELIFEVHKNQAEALAKEVKYIMEHIVCLSIPIVVDVSVVQTYGD